MKAALITKITIVHQTKKRKIKVPMKKKQKALQDSLKAVVNQKRMKSSNGMSGMILRTFTFRFWLVLEIAISVGLRSSTATEGVLTAFSCDIMGSQCVIIFMILWPLERGIYLVKTQMPWNKLIRNDKSKYNSSWRLINWTSQYWTILGNMW